jgi:hypothetical protein
VLTRKSIKHSDEYYESFSEQLLKKIVVREPAQADTQDPQALPQNALRPAAPAPNTAPLTVPQLVPPFPGAMQAPPAAGLHSQGDGSATSHWYASGSQAFQGTSGVGPSAALPPLQLAPVAPAGGVYGGGPAGYPSLDLAVHRMEVASMVQGLRAEFTHQLQGIRGELASLRNDLMTSQSHSTASAAAQAGLLQGMVAKLDSLSQQVARYQDSSNHSPPVYHAQHPYFWNPPASHHGALPAHGHWHGSPTAQQQQMRPRQMVAQINGGGYGHTTEQGHDHDRGGNEDFSHASITGHAYQGSLPSIEGKGVGRKGRGVL